MGTGKTAVGKELAKIKKWQFIDLDELIQLREKRTIADIFAKEGEPYFRKVEKQVLKEVAGKKEFVVSCGGGIVLDKENIQVMSQTGIMICLSARPEAILKRTAGYRHRPLLNNVENPEKRIKELLSQRAPFYAQADYTIDTSDLEIPEVISRVLEHIKKRGQATF